MTKSDMNVLHALSVLYLACGRATVRDVAAIARRSVATTHWHLKRLELIGLVEYDKAGTLRPGTVG